MRRFFGVRFSCTFLFCCLLVSLLLLSCVGTASWITFNQDGSGLIHLEYRISQELEAMGKQDGNEKWLPIPAGRADMERTAARVSGLSLVSYSSRVSGKDSVHIAEFSFDSADALCAFLDSQGQQCKADFNGKRMVFSFPQLNESNPEYKKMISEALYGYDFSFSLAMPGKVNVSWLDKEGKPLQTIQGSFNTRNNTIEYTVPMAQLVFLDASQTMEVRW
jgi:hypothetical protein